MLFLIRRQRGGWQISRAMDVGWEPWCHDNLVDYPGLVTEVLVDLPMESIVRHRSLLYLIGNLSRELWLPTCHQRPGVSNLLSARHWCYHSCQVQTDNSPSSPVLAAQHLTLISPNLIRLIIPVNINLPNQNRAPNRHSNRNDRQIHPRKLTPKNADMLFVQDISPEQARKRRAESSAESAVVDADGHAVHCRPERAVADWDAVVCVNLLPCLDDAREEDGGADVCACELMGC